MLRSILVLVLLMLQQIRFVVPAAVITQQKRALQILRLLRKMSRVQLLHRSSLRVSALEGQMLLRHHRKPMRHRHQFVQKGLVVQVIGRA